MQKGVNILFFQYGNNFIVCTSSNMAPSFDCKYIIFLFMFLIIQWKLQTRETAHKSILSSWTSCMWNIGKVCYKAHYVFISASS